MASKVGQSFSAKSSQVVFETLFKLVFPNDLCNGLSNRTPNIVRNVAQLTFAQAAFQNAIPMIYPIESHMNASFRAHTHATYALQLAAQVATKAVLPSV